MEVLGALKRAIAQRPEAAAGALDPVVNALIEEASLARVQELYYGATQCVEGSMSALELATRLKQPVAVSTAPRKAVFLGCHWLLLAAASVKDDADLLARQRLVLDVCAANVATIAGFSAAVESTASPFFMKNANSASGARHLLQLLSTVMVHLATRASGDHQDLLQLVLALQRVAWDDRCRGLQSDILALLLRCCALLPVKHSGSVVFNALVASIAELGIATQEEPASARVLTELIALVLPRVAHCIKSDIPCLAVVQWLPKITKATPQVLWDATTKSKVLLLEVAFMLVETVDTSMERRLLLEMLRDALLHRQRKLKEGRSARDRTVLIEFVVTPLVALLQSHPTEASELLTIVGNIQASSRLSKAHSSISKQQDTELPSFETFCLLDVLAAVALDQQTALKWLHRLLETEPKAGGANESLLVLSLCGYLADERHDLRTVAASVVDKRWRTWTPAHVMMVLSMLISSLSSTGLPPTRQSGEWVAQRLHLIAQLAASSNDAMKIVLRMLKRMRAAPRSKAMALKLLGDVWKVEPRVFPWLQDALKEETSEEEDKELHIVKAATILAIYKKDPEVGVDLMSSINAFVHDELVSVAAMALEALRVLCTADCLDFYTVFKMLATMIRKKRLPCADEELFQVHLCRLLAVGHVEMTDNAKHSRKLLESLWSHAESEFASVRCSAFEALNAFPLEALDLVLVDPRDKAHDAEGSDDEEESDDETTEADIEENIDSLVQRLDDETDATVRLAIEKIMTRVLASECTKITAGGGRGQASASSFEARVSASATRALKDALPSRNNAIDASKDAAADSMAWTGYLLAFEPPAIDANATKRKDKLLKAMTQSLEAYEKPMDQLIAQMWLNVEDSGELAAVNFAATVTSWQKFMSGYVGLLSKYAITKSPSNAEVGAVEQNFANLLTERVQTLESSSSGKSKHLIALGALVDEASKSALIKSTEGHNIIIRGLKTLFKHVAVGTQELRVFKTKGHDQAICGTLGLAAAATATLLDGAFMDEAVAVLMSIVVDSSSAASVRACSALALGELLSARTSVENEGKERSILEDVAKTLLQCFVDVTFASGQVTLHLDRVFQMQRSGASDLADVCSATLKAKENDRVLQLGLLMAINRLGGVFEASKLMGFVDNLQALMMDLWTKGVNVCSVSAGALLVKLVKTGLRPSNELYGLVERGLSSINDEMHLSLVVPFALASLPSAGCAYQHEQVSRLISALAAATKAGKTDQASFALWGVMNLLYNEFGIQCTERSSSPVVAAIALDDAVAAVQAIEGSTSACIDVSCFARSALADTKDRLVALQKKKLLETEMLELPATTLLAKVLQRLQADSVKTGAVSSDETAAVVSMASCLASVVTSEGSPGVPTLDYPPLVRRLMKRHNSDAVSASLIRFASGEVSCAEVMQQEIGHAVNCVDKREQSCAELARALRHPSAARWSTGQLIAAIHHAVLLAVESSSTSVRTEVLASLVALASNSSGRLNEDTHSAVKKHLWTRVLSAIPKGDEFASGFTKAVLAVLPSEGDGTLPWTDDRVELPLVHLTERLKTAANARQVGEVFQWLLRQDFSAWLNSSAAAWTPLVDELAKLVQAQRPSEHWLLELLDAIGRTLPLEEAATDQQAKYSVLIEFLASLISPARWQELVLPSDRAAFEHARTRLLALGMVDRRSIGALVFERLWSSRPGLAVPDRNMVLHASQHVLLGAAVVATPSQLPSLVECWSIAR